VFQPTRSTSEISPAVTPKQAVGGPSFAPWSPDDGPAAVLWAALVVIAQLGSKAADATMPALARVLALRLAHSTLARGWQAFEVWADEARFSGASYLGADVDQAHADLCRVAAELLALEGRLLGVQPRAPRVAAALARAGDLVAGEGVAA
jgi:hypothetical protein